MASRKQRATVPASTIFPPQVVSASALIAIVFIAYSKSLHGGFALDSNQLLLHDPRIQQVTSENLGRIFHHTYWWPYGESGLYRAFTTLSYLFNYAVLGGSGVAQEGPAGGRRADGRSCSLHLSVLVDGGPGAGLHDLAGGIGLVLWACSCCPGLATMDRVAAWQQKELGNEQS